MYQAKVETVARFRMLVVVASVAGALAALRPPACFAQALSAGEIMARVAENQDRAERLRSAYVYRQHIDMRLRNNDGRLLRQEVSEYTVMPAAEGFTKSLTAFSGRCEVKGQFVSYDKPGDDAPGGAIDKELIDELREELTADRKARDGLAGDLFPLSTRQQVKYDFKLEGRESYAGFDTYRVSFQPRKKRAGKKPDGGESSGEFDEASWAGEVLVNAEDFQPVLVTTRLARKVPFAIRTFLGTNLHGVGFTVRYEKFDGGVWFPVSFGTEFRVNALFFYKRIITASLKNSDFRRADVGTTIRYEDPPH